MELQKKDVAVLTPDMVKIDSNSKTAATDSNNNSAEDGGLNIKDQLTAGMTKKDDTDQDQKSSVVNIHQVVDALATQAGGLSLESSKELDSFVDDDDSDSSEEEDVKLSDSKKSNYRRNIEHTKNCNAMVNYVIGRNGTKNVYKLLRENDKSGKFYVYALLSGKEMPKTIEEFLFRLIYIGKGTGSRMDQHYSKLYNERWDSNEEKRKELRDLLNSRKGFIGIKIVENLSETLSLVLESPLIDKYSKQLLNKATGITIEQFDETLTTEICGQIWKDVEENLKAKDLVCKPYFLKETDKCLKLAKKKFQTITCEKCDGKIISKRQNQIHNRLMKKDNCSEEVTCPWCTLPTISFLRWEFHEHLYSNHSKFFEKEPFKCSVAGCPSLKKSSGHILLKGNFVKHLEIHLILKCKFEGCTKQLKNKRSRNNHEKSCEQNKKN